MTCNCNLRLHALERIVSHLIMEKYGHDGNRLLTEGTEYERNFMATLMKQGLDRELNRLEQKNEPKNNPNR